MSDVRYIEVKAEEDGQRLDNYLIRILKGVPKSHVYRIIRAAEVRVNKKRPKPDMRIHEGDMVRIPPVRVSPEKEVFVGANLTEQLEKSILYEDNQMLVVNKPSGIAVHGGSGLSFGLIEGFRKLRSDLSYLELVHRLDKETSGCILLAKKRSFLRSVQALFESRTIKKTYWALVAGPWVGKGSVLVDVPLVKNTLKSGERFVRTHEEGKSSQTTFTLLENYSNACWVEALPHTGRTHQIRVHSAYLGHPILGDDKYGHHVESFLAPALKKRLYLHAAAIQFNLNGHDYFFEASLDNTFEEAIAFLKESESADNLSVDGEKAW